MTPIFFFLITVFVTKDLNSKPLHTKREAKDLLCELQYDFTTPTQKFSHMEIYRSF